MSREVGPEGVGFTYVRLRISRDHTGPRRPIRLLLDTAAYYTMIRRKILEEMGVSPTSHEVLFRRGWAADREGSRRGRRPLS